MFFISSLKCLYPALLKFFVNKKLFRQNSVEVYFILLWGEQIWIWTKSLKKKEIIVYKMYNVLQAEIATL